MLLFVRLNRDLHESGQAVCKPGGKRLTGTVLELWPGWREVFALFIYVAEIHEDPDLGCGLVSNKIKDDFRGGGVQRD